MFELRANNQAERSTDMLMYGSIGEWSKIRAEDVWKSLQQAKSQGYEKVKLRINCPGGSIFEGIAIISAIQNSGIEVTACIDGMAASMGAVMIAAIDDVEMAEGARLMVHLGSYAAFGQSWEIKDQIELFDSLDRTLAEYLTKKTAKDKQWILDNWMKPGKDKWFTAKEAQQAKLIKRVIPGKVKPLPKEEATFYEMAAHYQSQLDTTNRKMEDKELIAFLGLKADASKEEIQAALNAMKAKASTAPAPQPVASAPAAPAAPAPTATSTDVIVASVEALAKAKGVTDEKKLAAIKVLAGVNVQAALDMIGDGAAAPTTTEKKDTPVNINELLTNLVKNGGSAAGAEDRKTWSFADWQKKDSQGLLAMAKSKPGDYAKLFEAAYGYLPTEDEIKKLSA